MNERVCLIVDDEPAIRTYLSVVLECKGIKCLDAENSAQAFRMLRKFGGQIDLLITDIDMPGDTDEINLADSAKKSFPKLPVLVVSDHIVTSAEGFAIVQKPFASDAILKAIDDTMRLHSAQLETPETSELRSDNATGSVRSCDRHPVAKKAAGRKLAEQENFPLPFPRQVKFHSSYRLPCGSRSPKSATNGTMTEAEFLQPLQLRFKFLIIFLLAWNAATLFAGTATGSPVLGLRPRRGCRLRLLNIPNPRISTFSPPWIACAMLSKITSTTPTASWGRSPISFSTASANCIFVKVFFRSIASSRSSESMNLSVVL